MPILGGLLVSLFGGLAGWLATWVSKKIALAASAITAFGILTGALFTATAVAIQAVSYTLPGNAATGVWLCVPDNAPLVIGVVLSFDATVALYRWNVENLKWAAFIS